MNPLLRKLRATPFVALLIFVPLAAAAVSLSVGRYAVHLGDALEIIFRVVKRGYAAAASVDPQERIIIGVRLPRVLLGLLVGGGLSVAGAGMQALLSNPLVSPDTLGVASGACFGAALALILNGGLVAVQLYGDGVRRRCHADHLQSRKEPPGDLHHHARAGGHGGQFALSGVRQPDKVYGRFRGQAAGDHLLAARQSERRNVEGAAAGYAGHSRRYARADHASLEVQRSDALGR